MAVPATDTIADELASSHALYRTLFDQNPYPMWLFDPDTLRFMDVNQAAVRHYGYSRDEFLAMRITDIRPTEDVPALLATLSEQGSWSISRHVSRHILKSGETIDVEITAQAIRFQQGMAELVVVHDVSPRMRAERERRETEERMHFALEASGAGLWEADVPSNTTWWSTTCEAMHGLAAGTFGGNYEAYVATIHPDDRDRVLQVIEEAMRERCRAQIRYRTLWPDGSERRIETTAFFTYDEDGAPRRGAGVTLDVTDRYQLEEKLRQAQKIEAVGQLAGGVAHDFNNLLTAILGNIDFVVEDLPESDQRRADALEARKAAQRAADLTRQLLAFSRKQILSPRALRVGEVVTGLIPMMSRLLGENIVLRTSLGDQRSVRADPGQLEQVVMNIAINGRDAMPVGGQLAIETTDVVLDAAFARVHRGATPGEHVAIRIVDTGEGMDDATQRRIFDPFFTTKPVGQGTGLGLATVYGIVQQSGGYITVESEPARGSAFTVYLPCIPEPAAPDAGPLLDSVVPRGSETVLVLEDEAVVREYAKRVLSDLGYRVLMASRPSDAIRMAKDREARGEGIDLVVSDVVLPEMSGKAAASAILARHAKARVLYMSGYADSGFVAQGELKPGISLLQKPFTREVLARRVREALGAPNATQ